MILLDEPFNAIDEKTVADLIALVRRWHDRQAHRARGAARPRTGARQFSETLLLAREPVAWGPSASVLTPENLTKARRMCEAFDEDAAPAAAPVRLTGMSALRSPARTFAEFEFMRRALVGVLALAVGAAPVGVS